MLDTLGEPCKDADINTEALMLQDPFADKQEDALAAAKGIGVALCMSAVIIFGLMALAWVVL